MAACSRYLDKAPRDFVTFEYVMLDGVNDSDTQAYELLELTRKVSCKFNLISVQSVSGLALSSFGQLTESGVLLRY